MVLSKHYEQSKRENRQLNLSDTTRAWSDTSGICATTGYEPVCRKPYGTWQTKLEHGNTRAH